MTNTRRRTNKKEEEYVEEEENDESEVEELSEGKPLLDFSEEDQARIIEQTGVSTLYSSACAFQFALLTAFIILFFP